MVDGVRLPVCWSGSGLAAAEATVATGAGDSRGQLRRVAGGRRSAAAAVATQQENRAHRRRRCQCQQRQRLKRAPQCQRAVVKGPVQAGGGETGGRRGLCKAVGGPTIARSTGRAAPARSWLCSQEPGRHQRVDGRPAVTLALSGGGCCRQCGQRSRGGGWGCGAPSRGWYAPSYAQGAILCLSDVCPALAERRSSSRCTMGRPTPTATCTSATRSTRS